MRVKLYINMLKEIIQCANNEMHNCNSMWSANVIKKIILPEMQELLVYAYKGVVLFKNNHLNGCLDSFNYISNSNEDLRNTTLGLKIAEIQKTHSSFPVMYLNKRSG